MNSHYCPEWDYMLITSECPEYECCMCPIKKEKNGNKMKIECTQSQWNILEACLYDGLGKVQTTENEYDFFSLVYSESGALVFEITGKFIDGAK